MLAKPCDNDHSTVATTWPNCCHTQAASSSQSGWFCVSFPVLSLFPLHLKSSARHLPVVFPPARLSARPRLFSPGSLVSCLPVSGSVAVFHAVIVVALFVFPNLCICYYDIFFHNNGSSVRSINTQISTHALLNLSPRDPASCCRCCIFSIDGRVPRSRQHPLRQIAPNFSTDQRHNQLPQTE